MARNLTWTLMLALLVGFHLAGCGDDAADDDDSSVGDDDDDATADDDDDDVADDDDDDDDVVMDEVDEADVVGNDYHVDLTTAEFVEPPGIGVLLSKYMGEIHLAFHVTALDGDANTAELFSTQVTPDGAGYVQDLCLATQDLSASAVWMNPALEMTYDELVIGVMDAQCLMTGLVNKYSFEDGGETFVAGTMVGLLDTRCLDETIDPKFGPGAACDLLGSMGIKCVACDDGTGEFCLGLVTDSITGAKADVFGNDPETGDDFTGLQAVTDTMVADWVAGGYCS